MLQNVVANYHRIRVRWYLHPINRMLESSRSQAESLLVLSAAHTVTSWSCTEKMSGHVLVEQVSFNVYLPRGLKVHDTLTALEKGRVVLYVASKSEQDIWIIRQEPNDQLDC